MINFLHNYLPRPILFEFGFLQIHWYGLMVVLGIIAALAIVLKLAKKQGISADEVFNIGFYVIIAGLLGARLYAVLLAWPYYLKNPLEILAVWHGGLAIHGAIFGGAAAVLIYAFKKKQSFWLWLDLAAPGLALGQAVGRFGNYFNQEVFGRPTDLPWGIPISLANRPAGFEGFLYFQPTFVYEAGLDLVNFLVLLALFFWFKRETQKHKNTKTQNLGFIFLIYLINYSVIRILLEFLRIDETPVVFGLRWPVIVSGLLIILSLIVISVKLKTKNAK